MQEVDESGAKKQRKDEFNITESLNVVISGLNSTPSVVPSNGLRIVAEAFTTLSAEKGPENDWIGEIDPVTGLKVVATAFVSTSTPWTTGAISDNEDDESPVEGEADDEDDNNSVYSPTSPAHPPTSPAFSPTSPMPAGDDEQEDGAEESKSEAAVQAFDDDTDVIVGHGWNKYGEPVQPEPEKKPWRLSLLDINNRNCLR